MIQVPREEELHVLLEKNMSLISDSSPAGAMPTAAGSAGAMVNYRDLAAALVRRIVLPADRSKEPDVPEVPERAARVEKRINGKTWISKVDKKRNIPYYYEKKEKKTRWKAPKGWGDHEELQGATKDGHRDRHNGATTEVYQPDEVLAADNSVNEQSWQAEKASNQPSKTTLTPMYHSPRHSSRSPRRRSPRRHSPRARSRSPRGSNAERGRSPPAGGFSHHNSNFRNGRSEAGRGNRGGRPFDNRSDVGRDNRDNRPFDNRSEASQREQHWQDDLANGGRGTPSGAPRGDDLYAPVFQPPW